MPFLKRDFAIFLGLVAFLLAGIIVTGVGGFSVAGQTASVIDFADTATSSYTAVSGQDKSAEIRANQLKDMTDRVKDRLASLPAEVAKPAVSESANKPETNDGHEKGAVLTCSEYATINPVWRPAGLKFDLVEGALIVYRNKEVATPVEAGTSTVATTPTIEREVVLQLPYRSYSSNQQTCLANDVVGIALDGSLIRNGDYTAYQIFGGETQIGYALDGFPIYGTANFSTDVCGGSDDSGFYRYYLNKDRKGVLGCFSATPVSL